VSLNDFQNIPPPQKKTKQNKTKEKACPFGVQNNGAFANEKYYTKYYAGKEKRCLMNLLKLRRNKGLFQLLRVLFHGPSVSQVSGLGIILVGGKFEERLKAPLFRLN